MTIDIIPISMDHVESLHRAVDTVARERKYLAGFAAPPLPSTFDFVQKNIDNGQSQFVALQDEAVIGWCDILAQSDALRSHIGVVGMGVLAPFRGQGIGSKLLNAALADVRKQNLHRIELKVRASNTPAIRLYERTGFAHEATLRDDVLLDGQLDSTRIMVLFPEMSA